MQSVLSMREFIKKLIKFLAILVIVSILFISYSEILLHNYPSTFQLKAKNITKNKDNIDVLILGSSHNQVGINPYLIKDFQVSNLAFGGQTLTIDYNLLKHYIINNKLPKLKKVVFELSYHTLEETHKSNYHRNSLYLHFYGINCFNRNVNFKDYSIYFSNPILYNRFLNPFTEKEPVNKYGFIESLSKFDKELHIFENLNYDENVILNDTNSISIKRHKYENLKAFNSNKELLFKMIELCIDHDVTPIILIPPVYKSYFDGYIKAKKNRRNQLMASLLVDYPKLTVMNCEQSEMFSVRDFKNADHLNPKGAAKFSVLINELFKSTEDLKTQINGY